jgi:hypothetical protein
LRVGLSEGETLGSLSSKSEHVIVLVFKWVPLLFTELRAPGVRDVDKYKSHEPSSEAETYSNDPVRIVETALVDLKSTLSELNDECLATSYN